MIVVIFEGTPREGKMEEYLERAPKYKDELTKIDGFVANERYQHCSNPNKVLSISFWKDEESVKRFRELEMHRQDEKEGKENLFEDYRICIAKVFRDYGLNSRGDAPK
ncbi:MAG TPA: antibiotic biosynthesis monooxygenase [Cyclobacteriaceae bacterium]|jgi:heme-degrading monooxygenase HmoA|nr:antibiotic biosynthesis monooxygenase [Cyclobacteriaceae bacterium]